jgi:phenylpropionate dioxygenase-like ring-hydroxylating dioxygenase large terminal subunit
MNTNIANHLTPLIRNCWYVAALGSEITRDLKERTLLGVPVVMYRTQAGAPVILSNRCLHRSFPLSKGRLEGDTVICGYHGMQYEPSGQCIAMPSLANAPTHARLQGFKAVERGPVVWVWMGDVALADETAIVDMPWLASPDWATVGGQFNIPTNYVAMHENLLDQTHFAVLHADTVGTPAYARSDLEVVAEGDQIRILRELLDSEPPPIYAVPMKLEGRRVNRYSDSRFASPALHVAHARIENPAPQTNERSNYRVNIVHAFTPEHQGTIHYWWFNSRDFALQDAGSSDYLWQSSMRAYQEDVDALTWIQQNYDLEHQQSGRAPHELSFRPDKPGIMMRQLLQKCSTFEQSSS